MRVCLRSACATSVVAALLVSGFVGPAAVAAQTGTPQDRAVMKALKGRNLAALHKALPPGSTVQAGWLCAAAKFPTGLAFLLERGGYANEPCPPLKAMPLEVAIMSDEPESVRLLLQAGAQREVGGISAQEFATRLDKRKALAALVEHAGDTVRPESSLWLLARQGDAANVHALLVAGADPNRKTRDGTPLHAAAWGGHDDVVALLLEAGADPHARDARGRTPLMAAASSGRGSTLALLLKAGAAVDARDDDGLHAISYAAGVDEVAFQIEALSPQLRRAREAPSITGDGEYEPGPLRLPCAQEGGHNGPAEPGQQGTSRLIVTSIAGSGHGGGGKPPECAPVDLEPGTHHLTVTETSYDWQWVSKYELRQTSGEKKILTFLRKTNQRHSTRTVKAVVRKKPSPEPPEKDSPHVRILQPLNGDQFAYDLSPDGRLEIGVEAVVSPPRCEKSTRWKMTIGDSRGVFPKGAAGHIVFHDLPSKNTAFGPVQITASACGVTSAPVTVYVFYARDLSQHPPPAKGDTPNWFYYWGQTRAGRGYKPVYIKKRTGYEGKDVAGQYDYGSRKIVLTELAAETCYKRTAEAPHHVGRASNGIDCYAELVRHETQHQREHREWWGGTNPVALRAQDSDAYRQRDKDGDLVPDHIERQRAYRHCDPDDRTSCKGRPGDRMDNEMDAYFVGWSWVPGAAYLEDWSLDAGWKGCDNAKWTGLCPPPNW